MTLSRLVRLWLAVLTFAGAFPLVGQQPAVRIEFVSPAATQPHRQDKNVIFYDGFDQAGDLKRRYFEYGGEKGDFTWRPGEGIAGGGAMRTQFEKGQISAGGLKVVFGKNPFRRGPRQDETFREIYYRVYVKHEEGWQGNPAKLARATSMAGTDWSQGFIAHVWGGKGDVLCIDPATGIRDSRKVTTKYNDFPNLRWLGVKHGQTPVFNPAESGRWVCVESRVKLNTPGLKDGIFVLWVDGKLEASRTDLDWHGQWNDYAINAVFLGNYWNNGSVKRQARWFDDFVISTQPIGPITAGPNSVIQRTAKTIAQWQVRVCADPDGRDVLWTSGSIEGSQSSCKLEDGTKAGSIYWIQARESATAGAWSDWSACHAPFRAGN